MKNILVDCDGVISNFSLAFSKLLRELYGNHLPLITNANNIPRWNWHEWYPLEKDKLDNAWICLKQDPYFWQSMEVIDRKQLNHLHDKLNHYYDVYFVTTRMSTGGKSAVKQTVKWLENYGWKHPQVIATENKGIVAKALEAQYFIDDSGKNCLNVFEYIPECKIYIMEAGHNKNINHSHFRKVNDLYQFVQDIENNV